jgi:hypothetical protein
LGDEKVDGMELTETRERIVKWIVYVPTNLVEVKPIG